MITGLRTHLQFLARRWRVFAAVLGTVLVVAAIQTALTPVRYDAQAEIVLIDSAADDPLGLATPLNIDRRLPIELRELSSRALKAEVGERLGTDDWTIETASRKPDLLTVKASAASAELAAQVADTTVTAFLEMRRGAATDRLDETRSVIVNQMAQIEADIGELKRQVEAGPGRQDLVLLLESRVKQLGVFTARLDEIDFRVVNDTAGLATGPAATVPSGQASPNLVRNALVAALSGVVLGGLIAFGLDATDDTLRRATDITDAFAGLPVLGTVPAGSRRTDSAMGEVGAESIRQLRTTLRHSLEVHGVKILHLAEVDGDESATPTAVALASTLANAGLSVVLVDGNLDQPSLHQFFDGRQAPGFADVLRGDVRPRDVVQRVDDEESVWLVPAGDRADSVDLVAGRDTGEILTELAGGCDLLIIDSPPLLTDSDAAVLAGHADASLLLVRADRTPTRRLRFALNALDLVEADPLGIVVVGGHPGDVAAPSDEATAYAA